MTESPITAERIRFWRVRDEAPSLVAVDPRYLDALERSHGALLAWAKDVTPTLQRQFPFLDCSAGYHAIAAAKALPKREG